jgi:dUTP pyrophosphatase
MGLYTLDNLRISVEVLEGGKMPQKAHKADAGFDVFTPAYVRIEPGKVYKIPLNIRLELPPGCWARVETKSGLGARGMLVYAGVIDQGYRGIVHAICTNLSNDVIELDPGDKIAQITLNPHSESYFMHQVDSISAETERGEGGFGSSGN